MESPGDTDSELFIDNVEDIQLLPRRSSRKRMCTRYQDEDMVTLEDSSLWSPALSRALQERYGDNVGKKPPRSLTRLMQLHRENERHRHRGLNASISEISQRIPGFDEQLRETKIVKLQRIINYICHLEVNIKNICDDIGFSLDYKSLFLSPHITKTPDDWKPVAKPETPNDKVPPRKYHALSLKQHLEDRNHQARLGFGSQPPSNNKGRKSTYNRQPSTSCGHIPPRCKQSLRPRAVGYRRTTANTNKKVKGFKKAGETGRPSAVSHHGTGAALAKQDTEHGANDYDSRSTSEDEDLAWLDAMMEAANEDMHNMCHELLNNSSVLPDDQDQLLPLATEAEDSPEDLSHQEGQDHTTPYTSSHSFYPPAPGCLFQHHPGGVGGGGDLYQHHHFMMSPQMMGESFPHKTLFIKSNGPKLQEKKRSAATAAAETARCDTVASTDQAKADVKTELTAPTPVKSASPNDDVGLEEGRFPSQQTEITQNADPSWSEYRVVPTADEISTFHSYARAYEDDQGATEKFDGWQLLDVDDEFDGHPKSAPGPISPIDRHVPATIEVEPLPLDETLPMKSGDGDLQYKVPEEGDGPFPISENECLILNDQTGFMQPTDVKSEVDDNEVLTLTEKNAIRPEKKVLRPINLRKASWMNGFMMYSRLHRKKYIEDNPGVHASRISRLMGIDWRKLKDSAKKPYREKARMYVESHQLPQ